MKVEMRFYSHDRGSLGSYSKRGRITVYLRNVTIEFQTEERMIQAIGDIITHEIIFHHLTRNEVKEWCWGEDDNPNMSYLRGYAFVWDVEAIILRCLGKRPLRTKRYVLAKVKRCFYE